MCPFFVEYEQVLWPEKLRDFEFLTLYKRIARY